MLLRKCMCVCLSACGKWAWFAVFVGLKNKALTTHAFTCVQLAVLQYEISIFLVFFVIIEMDVSVVSWKDFCCMVAPSHCPISFSPRRERPGIWGDRPRLAHKSLPWGPLQSSDFITLRLSVLWSSWRCIPATVAFSWYELAADCGTTQSTQNCQGYSASIWLQ